MLLDNPFPLESLPPRIREQILAEFGGRHPTILEVATIPDTHWLELPSFGPKMLARMRSLTRGARRQARVSAQLSMSDAELEAEYERLKGQRKAIDEQIKTVRAELLLRRLLPMP